MGAIRRKLPISLLCSYFDPPPSLHPSILTSNSILLMHLYQYFAALLGCSQFGKTEQKYAGDPSMYNVHKYMALSNAEVGYFIQQVGLSAASFGVAEADVKAVGEALTDAFGYKCAPKAMVVGEGEELQSICTEVRRAVKDIGMYCLFAD